MSTLIEDGRFALRALRVRDLELVYECLEDWAPDENGSYTLQRAETTLSVWLRQSADFRAAGEGTQALVFVVDGAPAGICASTHLGTTVSVDLVAIHPEFRGRGLLKDFMAILRVYGFETLGVEHVQFETRADPGAIASQVDVLEVPEVGQRASPSGRQLRVWAYDRDHREARIPEHDAGIRARRRAAPSDGATPSIL